MKKKKVSFDSVRPTEKSPLWTKCFVHPTSTYRFIGHPNFWKFAIFDFHLFHYGLKTSSMQFFTLLFQKSQFQSKSLKKSVWPICMTWRGQNVGKYHSHGIEKFAIGSVTDPSKTYIIFSILNCSFRKYLGLYRIISY